jgi:tetratricopeptide (TPR) repeat protein
LTKAGWKTFPHRAAFDLPGDTLRKRWPQLHLGDCEPFPSAPTLAKLVARYRALEPAIPLEDATEALQEGWRCYHRGDFGDAVDRGLSLGPLGYNLANKAAIIYATHRETAEKRKLALLLSAAQRAEELQCLAETVPNAWYLHAQALGRYAQGISVARALAEGLGGKVKTSLERTIALEPKHADAHIALGMYHAEVINKIGGLVAGFTYGASRDEGLKHLERALKLNPKSPIAHIEYAHGLLLMFGDSKAAQARRHYREAAECSPGDAMEHLDVELARAELEG